MVQFGLGGLWCLTALKPIRHINREAEPLKRLRLLPNYVIFLTTLYLFEALANFLTKLKAVAFLIIALGGLWDAIALATPCFYYTCWLSKDEQNYLRELIRGSLKNGRIN